MRMRVLRRYTILSVLKIALATALLASLILMGVDLFANLDSYMNNNVSFVKAMSITSLYFPSAFLLAIGPSFLFAVSFHLSSMHSSNEILVVLDSGVSISRLVAPIIILGVLVTGFHFVLNETVAIPLSNQKKVITENITDTSSNGNNQNVALSDMQSGYMVYAGLYNDKEQTLYDVSIVQSDETAQLKSRTDAYKAVYNPNRRLWTIYDAYVYSPTGNGVRVDYIDSIDSTVLKLEPQLFRDVSNEISNMSLKFARSYLMRIKGLNPEGYASLATEYYERILGCLTPLVMIIIACSITYRFKKNVLFFSLVGSICIAVVYYVVRMVTIMLADQGVIAPALGTLIPFAAVIVVSSGLRAFLVRQ